MYILHRTVAFTSTTLKTLNLQLLSGITCKFFIQNFTQIGQDIWKVRAEVASLESRNRIGR